MKQLRKLKNSKPFCIAVTKRHFGDVETGERGDMWEYLTGGKT